MKKKDLFNRILTSFFLVLLLILSFNFLYILITSLILISILSWIEFHNLIKKILIKKSLKINFIKLFINSLSLMYLILFSLLIYSGISDSYFRLNILYLICVCIFSDIGGLMFGKVFKGKKLTKISPNKTISGSFGSFILSLLLIPIFYYLFPIKFNILINLTLITLIVSFSCQLGDLFISYLKRKANVKDTGDLLPGHGGILDRIDGILFAIPIGIIIWNY